MPVVAAIMTTVGVGIQVESAKEQKEAAKTQQRARAEQQVQQKKLADIKSARERRRLVRERRKAQAEIEVAGRGTGDTRAAGVGASVVTQAAGAMGFAGQQQQIGLSIFERGLEASAASAELASAQAKGQIGGAVAGLATSTYSIFK